MKKHFTIKPVLIVLLAMISCTMKAEIVEYTTDDDLAYLVYRIDTETQEASLVHGGGTKVVVPASITYEGKEYKVTSLGIGCFCQCDFLTSIELPSSVKSLGQICFVACSALTTIEIPSSITSIGDSCFSDCSSLESIVVDENNPRYDSREGCNAIIETETNMMVAGCKNTRIPKSVTSLGIACFGGCSSLAAIEIPSSVISMGNACFGGCSSLTAIKIPSSVTSLGYRCFANCSSLTSIEIPASVKSLGEYCFSGCSSLTSIEIPASVKSLGKYCFRDCSSLTSIKLPESVQSFGKYCFSGCSSITSIEIPESMKKLDEYCFSGCFSLKTVICKMKTGIENIRGLFDGIPIGVATLYVPESMLPIYQSTSPWYGFDIIQPWKEGMEIIDYTTDDGFSYILNTDTQEAFLNKYSGNATKVVIPEFITYGEKAYKVTRLGGGCFGDSPSLTSIEIPSSVTSLGNACFNDCSSLTSIELPSSVTGLGEYCFYGCSSLTSIELPSSVTGLGEYCFYGCSSLTSIELPSSVTGLGEYSFYGCSSLASIELPSSVTGLGEYCFYGCSSLASIEIPSSVTSLGWSCFKRCSSLKTVICKMETEIEDRGDLFEGVLIEDATLYVPYEMFDTYKSTYPWSCFDTILPLTEESEVSVDETPELGITLKTNNGNVVVSGLADGTPVSCYTPDGRMLGKASTSGGTATFTAEPNSIVIVKVGKQTFKVYVK